MNLDAMGMLAITTVATVVQAIFWRWVSSISDTSKDNAKKLEDYATELGRLRAEIYRDYQSKGDAHTDNQRIMQALTKIETDVGKISDKLDKKVDK